MNVKHNNPEFLDARVFPSVVLAVAHAVTMDEASSLSEWVIGVTLNPKGFGFQLRPRVNSKIGL